MNPRKIAVVCAILALPLISGCDTADPTTAVLNNQYPPQSDASSADSMPVYRGWWAVAQFPEPVRPGQVSDPVRVVRGSDYGYALLAPGWDLSSGAPPQALIALRSADKLSVERGELLTFVVSEQDAVGDCRAGKPLSQDEADFVTQRIFPGEFAGRLYDAATCTTTPSATGEGGAAGGSGAP